MFKQTESKLARDAARRPVKDVNSVRACLSSSRNLTSQGLSTLHMTSPMFSAPKNLLKKLYSGLQISKVVNDVSCAINGFIISNISDVFNVVLGGLSIKFSHYAHNGISRQKSHVWSYRGSSQTNRSEKGSCMYFSAQACQVCLELQVVCNLCSMS